VPRTFRLAYSVSGCIVPRLKEDIHALCRLPVCSAGLELLFVVAMATFQFEVDELVVRIILLAHAGAVGAALVLSLWVVATATRARRRLRRDMNLLENLRGKQKSRASFVASSPVASHKIASMFRYVAVGKGDGRGGATAG
jgi:hypothetical protein